MRRPYHLAPLMAVMALAACQTLQGAGRDIETAGMMLTGQQPPAYDGQTGPAQDYSVQDPYASQDPFGPIVQVTPQPY